MPARTGFPSWTEQADYKIVDRSNVRDALQELVSADVVAWDSEFDDSPTGQFVNAWSFSTRINSGWLLPMRMQHVDNLSIEVCRKFIYAISKKENVVQTYGAELASCLNTWPDQPELCRIDHDVQVIWYQLDPNDSKDFREAAPRRRGSAMPAGFSLTQMALKYLKLEIPDLSDYFKSHSFAELDPETARIYACSDSDVALRLFQHPRVTRSQLESFIYKVDMGVLPVLADMEKTGFLFDKARLAEVEKVVRVEVAAARDAAYAALSCDPASVNIDSATQLARHLFNVLNWPIVGKKRKDGLGSTDKVAMSRYAESANPSIANGATSISAYKRLKTLHNNFLTKMGDYVNPVTGAIHCHFLSTVVPTGRLACASPNLQQVPRAGRGNIIRACFRAREGYFLMEADHSQIELRVYGGESRESYYFDSFTDGADLHLKTASVIYRREITDRKAPERDMGKVMNFGPIYGMKAEGLAMRTDYSVQEAQAILDDFFAVMPDAVKWTDETHKRARQLGGVHTHFGRWRPLPWITSRIAHEVEFGERSAVNTIVQGTAADIMKIGLIRLWKALRKPDCPFDARLILTVHDSVILEVNKKHDPREFFEFVRDALCFNVEGYPPLDIDAKWGYNWHDMQELEDETTPEPDEPQAHESKNLQLPALQPEQLRELIDRVSSANPGPFDVTILRPDGSAITVAPISMDGLAYASLLQFVLQCAQANKPADTPKVVFA